MRLNQCANCPREHQECWLRASDRCECSRFQKTAFQRNTADEFQENVPTEFRGTDICIPFTLIPVNCTEGPGVHTTEENLAKLTTAFLLFGFSTLPLITYFIPPKWTHSSTGLMATIVEQGPHLQSVDEAICAAGTLGMCYMWHKRRGQPNWLVNHLFYPGFLNSIVGVFVAAIVASESSIAASTSAIQILPILPALNHPLVITGLSAVVWGTLTCVYGLMGFPSHDYEVQDHCTDGKQSVRKP
ncbi:hypothetical protein BD410DRAFT_793137 [Rickenella mellea]|uniref:Uncharacterized protein n=1 Tax=Rickenella mellea TaxID=50990 RepID=A0A4Y7PT56_9AGAM|nr:hypothetical protein BD410DRAFT_793137 [Rickenella mellea]